MAEDSNNGQARLPFQEVPAKIRQKLIDLGGVPDLNLHRILSNHPILLSSWIDFAYSLRHNCTSSRQFRELMILRGAQLGNAKYQWSQHEPMARESGISLEKIDSIKEWEKSSLFDEKEKVVLKLMEALFQKGGQISVELDRQLKNYFTEAEYLELILTGSFYVHVSTMLNALQIPVEN